MKKYLLLLVVLALMVGCTEDHTAHFVSSTTKLVFNTRGDELSVDIKGDSPYWTATCSDSWIECKKRNQTLLVKAFYNFGEERQGYINILYRGETIGQIEVSQEAMEVFYHSFPSAGGEMEINISTSEISSLQCNQEWLNISMTHNSLLLSANANSGKERESAQLYVNLNDGQAILIGEFTQEGLDVSEDMIPMVEVQGGTYYQGAQAFNPELPRYDPLATVVEGPVHQVTLNRFSISKYEVDQALWIRVMGYNNAQQQHPSLPITNVTLDEIQQFIQRLNELLHSNYRLPTEWECAAKEGSADTYFYSGSDVIDEVGWYYSNSFKMMNFCGQKQPNSLGIYDMTGNVMEVCAGSYVDYPDYPLDNPYFEQDNYLVVARGGSWNSPANNCRSTYRYTFDITYSADNIGFRLAK